MANVLQLVQAATIILALGEDFGRVAPALVAVDRPELHRVGSTDMVLKLDSEDRLLSFDVEKRFEFTKEVGSNATPKTPCEQRLVLIGLPLPLVEVATPSIPALPERPRVSHIDSNDKLEPYVIEAGMLPAVDGNETFSVEEPRNVVNEAIGHTNLHIGFDEKQANSVELRCPARKGAEGQYRAKQGRDGALGVCNEHVPAPKGKMCSGLMGNHERLAEMISPDRLYLTSTSIAYQVTERNNDDIHFMVDPKALFKWTEPRTPVAQLTYTRICYLRTFLCVRARMFLGVASIAAA